MITSTPEDAAVEFCLRASAVGRSVTLVKVNPTGVSLSLTAGRRLVLAHEHETTVTSVTAGTHRSLVRVVFDRSRRRAVLFVGGKGKGSVTVALAEGARVYLGGSAASAPVALASPPSTKNATTALATAASVSPAKTTTVVVSTNGAVTTTKQSGATGTAPTASDPSPTTSDASNIKNANVSTTPPTSVTPAEASVVPGNPFSPTSFWNAPLSSTAPVDPNSQAYVNDLTSQIAQYGAWMNTTSFSTPVYVVPAGQPTVRVTLDAWGPDLQQEFDAVPIPAGATAAAGTDEHMTVWQPSTDKMWEFWRIHQVNGVWNASWGGEMDNVSTNPGYFTHAGESTNWGATATGLPLLGGLVTIADLERGSINHALALAVPLTEANVFSWPAQRTDGQSTAATALPEGLRFRLNPNLNIASLHLPYLDSILAHAAQTYGIVIRDTSGCVSLYGQDPTPTGSNPWAAPFDGWSEGTYLSWFPWNQLQALQTQLSG